MKKSKNIKKILILILVISFCSLSILPALSYNIASSKGNDEIFLPQPNTIDMKLEETIFRRMSIREYTDEPISDEDLSTILYAGFGLREDGKHTVAGIDNVNAAVLYVIREDGAYTYNPENHSLVFYKTGNWLNRVGWQYKTANILLGLCWKKDLADPNFAGVELGEIGQNIAFAANSLGIGTVVTGEVPPAIDKMGIPDDENGMIIMYMGHPAQPYNFVFRPLWFSLLPRVKKSTMSLSEAIENRIESTSFSGILSRSESSQILWASYGFSYNIDKSKQGFTTIKRHRTVPSGHGYYPLLIFAVTKNAIYRYYPSMLVNLYEVPVDFLGLPIISFLFPKKIGDKREIIAQASSIQSVSSAPLSLIIVLDLELAKDLSDPMFERFWYFEAGAAAHNVMLESTALGLKHNIAYPIDVGVISTQLKLNENQIPLLILPIGK